MSPPEINYQNDSNIAFENGNKAQKNGNFEIAEKYYKRAISLKHNFIDAIINLGVVLQLLGKIEEAETCYFSAIVLNPNDGRLFNNLGALYHGQFRFKEAEIYYRKALDVGFINYNIYYNLGRLLNDSGSPDGAEKYLQLSIDLQPDFIDSSIVLGGCFQKSGKFKKAEKYYRAAIFKKPDLPELHFNLGNILCEISQFESAINSYKNALNLRPGWPEANLNLGNALIRIKKYDAAVTCYREVIRERPVFAEVYNNLGNAFRGIGSFDEARESFKMAIILKPDYSNAHYNLGNLLIGIDAVDEAAQHYGYLVKNQPAEIKGLCAAVNLAIFQYLHLNFSEMMRLLDLCQEIKDIKDISAKNERAYWIYLVRLFDWHTNNKVHSNFFGSKIRQTIYVIGESHALGYHGLTIKNHKDDISFSSFWIPGCKAYHVGDVKFNLYRCKIKKIIQKLPRQSQIIFVIGEIDCRINEGIMDYYGKNPNMSLVEIAEFTASKYISAVAKEVFEYSHKVIIQGVPCPNVNHLNLKSNEFSNLILTIRTFNTYLRRHAVLRGFGYLDVYDLTDNGGGISNCIWHIDEHHLKPSAFLRGRIQK